MVDAAPAWRAPALVGLGVAAATAALAVVNPNTTQVPLCPLHAVTGFDCPFCGSLRAVHALAHQQLAEAASHNLLFTLAAPFLVSGWLLWLRASLRHPNSALSPPRVPRGVVAALISLTAVFFVARNLPALSWLASSA